VSLRVLFCSDAVLFDCCPVDAWKDEWLLVQVPCHRWPVRCCCDEMQKCVRVFLS
jgi:hypothetical protein